MDEVPCPSGTGCVPGTPITSYAPCSPRPSGRIATVYGLIQMFVPASSSTLLAVSIKVLWGFKLSQSFFHRSTDFLCGTAILSHIKR